MYDSGIVKNVLPSQPHMSSSIFSGSKQQMASHVNGISGSRARGITSKQLDQVIKNAPGLDAVGQNQPGIGKLAPPPGLEKVATSKDLARNKEEIRRTFERQTMVENQKSKFGQGKVQINQRTHEVDERAK